MVTVTPDDLGTYLGVTVDPNRAGLLIGSAVQLCESVVTPLPDGAEAVVLDVAGRAYTNPQGVQQQTVGPYSAQYGPVSGGLWLTRGNRSTLRRLAGGSGVFTIETCPATAGQGLPWWDAAGSVDDFDQVP